MGTLIRTRGTVWRVRELLGVVVVLESPETESGDPATGTPGVRSINPSPLGEEPLTIDVLSVA